jgi:hypothetical protein
MHSTRQALLLILALSVADISTGKCLAADSGVTLQQSETALRVTWPISERESGVAVFNLDEQKPLIESLAIAGKEQGHQQQ